MREETEIILDQVEPPLDEQAKAAFRRFAGWMDARGCWIVGHGVDGDRLVVDFADRVRRIRVSVTEMEAYTSESEFEQRFRWEDHVVPEGARP